MDTKIDKEKIEELRGHAKAEIAKMKQEVTEAIDKVDEYVDKHPKKAAAIAAGVGAALGAVVALLISSKAKKD